MHLYESQKGKKKSKDAHQPAGSEPTTFHGFSPSVEY